MIVPGTVQGVEHGACIPVLVVQGSYSRQQILLVWVHTTKLVRLSMWISWIIPSREDSVTCLHLLLMLT